MRRWVQNQIPRATKIIPTRSAHIPGEVRASTGRRGSGTGGMFNWARPSPPANRGIARNCRSISTSSGSSPPRAARSAATSIRLAHRDRRDEFAVHADLVGQILLEALHRFQQPASAARRLRGSRADNEIAAARGRRRRGASQRRARSGSASSPFTRVGQDRGTETLHACAFTLPSCLPPHHSSSRGPEHGVGQILQPRAGVAALRRAEATPAPSTRAVPRRFF